MRKELFDLTGKVALVTGGNGGIGFGMAKGLAMHGANVVIWGNKPEKNDRAVEELRSFGGEVRCARVDVADEDAVKTGIETIIEEFGRIDQAIANAGISIPRKDMFEISLEDFQRIQNINVHGVFFTLREAARHMIARGEAGERGGSLVSVASTASMHGAARNEHYGATKGAVVSLTRAWLEENCPNTMREAVTGVEQLYWGGREPETSHPDQKIWCDRMAERGWTAPNWPRAYGGGDLSVAEHKVLQEEMVRLGARTPLMSFGIMMLGPALLKYGTEEQKLEHLPKICRGDIRWCQGYSEPGAGSDLASLQTSAEHRGDHYSISGQKIWTSYAHKSDWIFCLVRTGDGGSKHAGVSFILVDMNQPGVTVRPIRLISGASAFCETFLDEARADKTNLIGTEGGGWEIAKYLLTHERAGVSFSSAKIMEDPLPHRAKRAFGSDANGRLKNGVLRSKIAQLELDAEAFAATSRRIREELASGQGLGAASSVLKYYGTELNKRREELIVAVAGDRGLSWQGDAYGESKIARDWLRSRANSIEGGSSEIQLNIIAKRILGLRDA